MDELRQRHTPKPPLKGSIPRVQSLVKNLDLFPKVHDDYVIRTNEGGFTSILTMGIMLFLALLEIYSFMIPQRHDVITVRESSDKPMFINFNITTYLISCGKLEFDITDEDGVHSFGSSSQLIRMNLDENGGTIGLYRIGLKRSTNACGYCYGANETGCCNTCEDVLSAYKIRGWDTWMILKYAPICKSHSQLSKPNNGNSSGYSRRVGCMLWGALGVNQVAGSIRIATRTGQIDRAGRPLFDNEILSRLNSTHYIEHFSFGDHIPGVQNPLDGRFYRSEYVSSHRYHLQMLPAIYRSYKSEKPLISNDISVHETDNKVIAGYNGYTDYEPGIFFDFHISPYMHMIEETKQPLNSLIIRICAVIGGVMAISRFIDTVSYYFMRRRR